MKKFLIAAAIILALGTIAFAEDAPARQDCVASMSQINPDIKVTEISPEEQSAVVAKKGPPPVVEPFTFAIGQLGDNGILIIHDGDCVLLPIGPAPIQQIYDFLGRVQANG